MQFGDEIDNDCDGEIDEEECDRLGMLCSRSSLSCCLREHLFNLKRGGGAMFFSESN